MLRGLSNKKHIIFAALAIFAIVLFVHVIIVPTQYVAHEAFQKGAGPNACAQLNASIDNPKIRNEIKAIISDLTDAKHKQKFVKNNMFTKKEGGEAELKKRLDGVWESVKKVTKAADMKKLKYNQETLKKYADGLLQNKCNLN